VLKIHCPGLSFSGFLRLSKTTSAWIGQRPQIEPAHFDGMRSIEAASCVEWLMNASDRGRLGRKISLRTAHRRSKLA
jgi:hypothetical protein